MPMASEASDDTIDGRAFRPGSNVLNSHVAASLPSAVNKLIEAFVGSLGTRIEHIAFIDLISLRYEIFVELRKCKGGKFLKKLWCCVDGSIPR